ncbi:hypothetical protein CR161_01870 [Prosthecochloris sp. ZM]|uniref:DUF4412 domain-containing protein n=1 Tax=Prosthecochloris sp. ZM TaxID=2283143 RepID=UPI000DF7B2E8|nr:DUF4412 domain-containing protein [Prosthecochloris sp. ZM]RDD29554.1 hypothetical protein CR161_01870 [Prosthecochloris sp. ZM]
MRKLIPILMLALFQISIFAGCQQNGEKQAEKRAAESSSGSMSGGLFNKGFEGILHMQISTPDQQPQNAQLFIAQEGTRFEMNIMNPGTDQIMMRIVTFTPSAEPNLLYTLNEKNKTYSVIDMEKLQDDMEELVEEESDDEFTVEKLGTETLHGYKCTHVRMTDQHGETELWLTKDLLSAADFARLQRSTNKESNTMEAAMKKAGLEGFPLKTLDKTTGTTMEFVEIERTSLDASLFNVPKGYTKKESAVQMMIPEISDEQMKQMENMQEMMNEEDMQEFQNMMKDMQQHMGGKE